MKASQKIQIGTWALSLHHDSDTNITSAIIITERFQVNDWARFVLRPLPETIAGIIEENGSSFCHPTFLPVLLLSVYTHRALEYEVWYEDKRIYELERDVGTTRAGVLARDISPGIFSNSTAQEAQERSWRLRVDLNSHLTEKLFMVRALNWQQHCVDFLKNCNYILVHEDDIEELRQGQGNVNDTLEYLRFVGRSLADQIEEHRARTASQLEAVCIREREIRS